MVGISVLQKRLTLNIVINHAGGYHKKVNGVIISNYDLWLASLDVRFAVNTAIIVFIPSPTRSF